MIAKSIYNNKPVVRSTVVYGHIGKLVWMFARTSLAAGFLFCRKSSIKSIYNKGATIMAKKEKDGNWFKRHKILTGILILFVIGTFSRALGDGEKNNTGDAAADTDTAQTAKKEQQTEFKVGEAATFDNKSITVTDVIRNYNTGNEFSVPESGKEFVLVTVSIANNSDSSLMFSTFEFKMQDSNGVQMTESLEAVAQGRLSTGTLAKGGKTTGNMAFEVPAGDKGLKLLYRNGSLFNNRDISFNL